MHAYNMKAEISEIRKSKQTKEEEEKESEEKQQLLLLPFDKPAPSILYLQIFQLLEIE